MILDLSNKDTAEGGIPVQPGRIVLLQFTDERIGFLLQEYLKYSYWMQHVFHIGIQNI